MIVTTTPARLAGLWEAMQRPAQADDARIAARARRIAEQGWIATSAIEDALLEYGLAWSFIGEAWDTLSIPQVSLFRRPRVADKQSIGSAHATAADFAAMLITCERLGLPVDPAPLVDLLRPGVMRQVQVTSAELHVLWFYDERHRCEPVTVASEPAGAIAQSKAVVLSTGYRADAWFDEAASPIRIVVTKPKRGQWRAAA